MMKKIRYSDIEGCLRLTNGEIEVVVTTEIGPRIVGYSLVGEENVLGLHPQAKVETELGTWKPIGGHRLWIAPETMPDSYAPDDAPVEHFYDAEKNSLRLIQAVEPVSQDAKGNHNRARRTGKRRFDKSPDNESGNRGRSNWRRGR
jgi:hypothetical protein